MKICQNFQGDTLNCSPFTNGGKRSTNQSPIHTSTSREEAWLLLNNMLTSAPHPSNSILFESNLPYISPNKAVLTVVIPTTQVSYKLLKENYLYT